MASSQPLLKWRNIGENVSEPRKAQFTPANDSNSSHSRNVATEMSRMSLSIESSFFRRNRVLECLISFVALPAGLSSWSVKRPDEPKKKVINYSAAQRRLRAWSWKTRTIIRQQLCNCKGKDHGTLCLFICFLIVSFLLILVYSFIITLQNILGLPLTLFINFG